MSNYCRPFKPLDLLEIYQLAKNYFNESPNFSNNFTFDDEYFGTKLIELSKNSEICLCVLIDETDKKIIGYGISTLIMQPFLVESYVYINVIYVVPEKRNLSNAKIILDYLTNYFSIKYKTVTAVMAGCDSGVRDNRPAIAFFKHNKFKLLGTSLIKKLK